MEYTLHLPPNYTKPILPDRDVWLEALRSGKYRQGRNLLKSSDNKYCCLGVLCEIFGDLKQDTVGNWKNGSCISYLNPENRHYNSLDTLGYFPSGVWVQIGNRGERKDSLGGCNDSDLNFNQIADIIEQVWENGTN